MYHWGLLQQNNQTVAYAQDYFAQRVQAFGARERHSHTCFNSYNDKILQNISAAAPPHCTVSTKSDDSISAALTSYGALVINIAKDRHLKEKLFGLAASFAKKKFGVSF